MGTIDLHLHSKCSDGMLTPSELVDKAFSLGVKIMALTDHDTVSGVREAQGRAKELGIQCIAGLEISARLNDEVHILGYNINLDNPEFQAGIHKLQELRRERNHEIIRKLRAHGIKLKVYDELDGESRGRTHIAKMLYEQGFVHSRAEAFDKYIGRNAPCYQNDVGITLEEAVKLIVSAGGTAVLAHPYRIIRNGELSNFVSRMVDYGLGGIEVYYPNYGKEVRQSIRLVANQHKLIITGGSDYHSEEYGAKIGSTNVILNEHTKNVLGIK